MSKVIKTSFYEASLKIDEEFDNAKLAAESNKPSDKASVQILDLKLEMTKIKNKLKEQDGSQKDTGLKASARGGVKKDE